MDRDTELLKSVNETRQRQQAKAQWAKAATELSLSELINWHSEQLAELQREQDGEDWAGFHRDAVALLTSIKTELS